MKPDAAPVSSAADALLAQRLAAQAFSSGDVGQFDELMTAGTRANLADNTGAAETAFRAALALQQKLLGKNNPEHRDHDDVAGAAAFQRGPLRRSRCLVRAGGQLAPQSADAIALARLLPLSRAGCDEPGQAGRGADAADAGRCAVRGERAGRRVEGEAAAGRRQRISRSTGPGDQFARAGSGVAHRPAGAVGAAGTDRGAPQPRRGAARARQAGGGGRPAEVGERSGARATDWRGRSGQRPAVPHHRADLGRRRARKPRRWPNWQQSTAAFGRALPGSKPLAETYLLHARELLRTGHGPDALPICHERGDGADGAEGGHHAGADGALPGRLCRGGRRSRRTSAQALLAEMFTAAQLAQGGITSQQIAQASATLAENARNPKVGEAIRRQRDLKGKLDTLLQPA